MEDRKQRVEELLLEYHLDSLSEADQAWLEAELDNDSQVRAKSERLGAILRPLDSWSVQPAPAGLADRVLRFVEARTGQAAEHSRGFRVFGAEVPVPVDQGDGSRKWLFSMRELVAVAACILMLFGVMVPGMNYARDQHRRALCGSHLNRLYRGTGMYQEMFTGSLPFAGNPPGVPWLPSNESDGPVFSNSRHPFLLLKLRLVEPDAFICPADGDAEAMSIDQVDASNDFASSRNVSYDSLNMSGEDPPVHPPMPIIYLSDRNPLFVGGRFDPTIDPDSTNSPTHRRGSGQNVLRLDGSSEWVTSPVYGAKRDNVWLIGRIRQYKGTESQTSPDDVFVIPGVPAEHAIGEAPMPPARGQSD
ncbi:MAG: hypothetical protein ABIG68_11100 [Acidobacteriota bacterium]